MKEFLKEVEMGDTWNLYTRAVLSDSQCRLYQKVVPHRIIDEDYHYFTLYAPSYRLLRPIPYADR